MRLVLVAVMVIGATGIAEASPESDKLFRDGKDLLKAGKLAEACDSFARSQELLPKVGTLLNLGDCREKQGHTATAWAVFLEAKVLASQSRDKSDVLMPAKLAEATRRAAALQLKLAYVTLTIAPDRQVEGLVIKRNGTVVDPATWNTPVPLDPGDYVIEASAPKYQPWSITQPLSPRERVAVVVETLVAEPVVVAVVPPVVPDERIPPDTRIVPSAPADGIALRALPHKGPVPRFRPLGIGVALAACPNCNVGLVGSPEVEESDTLVGARILGGVPVPGGMVRGIGSLLYSKFLNDKTDEMGVIRRYAFGLSVDYVWTPRPQIAFAGGVGIGIDYLSANVEVFDMAAPSDTTRWTTLRASPIIVRLLKGHVELGLHLQLVSTPDTTVLLGVAAIDVFPL